MRRDLAVAREQLNLQKPAANGNSTAAVPLDVDTASLPAAVKPESELPPQKPDTDIEMSDSKDVADLSVEPKPESSVNGLPVNKDPMADLFFSLPQPTGIASANGKAPENGSPFDTIPSGESFFALS